ncbi:MAG: hypothetical protein WDW19_00120 [Neisseriaceae bacterium]
MATFNPDTEGCAEVMVAMQDRIRELKYLLLKSLTYYTPFNFSREVTQ